MAYAPSSKFLVPVLAVLGGAGVAAGAETAPPPSNRLGAGLIGTIGTTGYVYSSDGLRLADPGAPDLGSQLFYERRIDGGLWLLGRLSAEYTTTDDKSTDLLPIDSPIRNGSTTSAGVAGGLGARYVLKLGDTVEVSPVATVAVSWARAELSLRRNPDADAVAAGAEVPYRSAGVRTGVGLQGGLILDHALTSHLGVRLWLDMLAMEYQAHHILTVGASSDGLRNDGHRFDLGLKPGASLSLYLDF